MKAYIFLLLNLLSISIFAQFGGGNGSGYTSTSGSAIGTCNTYATLSVSACDQYLLPSGAQTVNTSGSYFDVIPNLSGCDSLMTINLTMLGVSSSNTILMAGCDSLNFNGINYTNSGTYTQFLTNAVGCDSVLVLILGIAYSSTATLNMTACNSLSLHGQTHTGSGTYVHTLVNSHGCDSVITLNLTIVPIDSTVTLNGLTLTANQTGVTYQWLDCNNGYTILPGETAQSFTPAISGNYAVVVDNGTCSDTSACIFVPTTGIQDAGNERIHYYPNPTTGHITLDFGGMVEKVNLTLTDIAGRVVLRTQHTQSQTVQLEIPGPSGTYFLEVLMEDGGREYLKIVKVGE